MRSVPTVNCPRSTCRPPTNTTIEVPSTVRLPTIDEKTASRPLNITRARIASVAAPENRCPSYGSRAKLLIRRMAAKLSCRRAVMRDSSTFVRSAPGRIRRADQRIQMNRNGTTASETSASGRSMRTRMANITISVSAEKVKGSAPRSMSCSSAPASASRRYTESPIGVRVWCRRFKA